MLRVRHIGSIHLSIILLSLGIFSQKAKSQCLVDYTTYNYFCDLDTLILEAVPVSGTGPFSFIWETGETTQSIFIPLALGDYMLTMTDATGCTSIINCHIKPYPEVLFYPYNQNACEGDTVTLWLDWFRDSIPGATYLWSNGATTPSIQIYDDIVWSVTVTDPSTGCEFVIPPGLFDYHPTPYPTIVGPSMLCPGQTATLSVTGGPFGSILWQPGDVYAPTLDINQPGIYTVYGFSPEAGYCWHSDTILIEEGDIPPPVLTGPPNLCSGQNGTINITNSADYNSFIWSNGQNSSSIAVNQPGTYSVTVSNTGGCTATGEYTISPGQGASLSTSFVPATCGLSNGSIDLTALPSGNYTYSWSTGSTNQDLINIPGGNYSVTVTMSDGCTSTTVVNVPDNPIAINLTGNATPVTSCASNNGAIDINILPSGSYTIVWSNGSTNEDLNNIAAGTYTVTVTTGLTCTSTASFTVDNLSNEPDIQTVSNPATCGENNGSVNLQITSGTPPFSFIWSNGAITEDLNNLSAGSYSVTVTGANGCASSTAIEIADNNIPITLSGQLTNNTSCIGSNGSIDLSISPPGSYSFLWSNGMTTEDLNNISAGTYDVTVTLGISCQQTESFTLTNENLPFIINADISPNTSCISPNGMVDVTVTPAGTYVYAWSSGETSEDLQNLSAGMYTVTVTNTDGCMIASTLVLADSTVQLNISGLPTSNTSCQNPNGALDISVSPSGIYTYTWSNGAITEDLQSLSPGIYSVTVSDINNCSSFATYTVDNSSTVPLVSSVVSPETCGTSNGIIDLTTSPAGLSFLWSNGAQTEDLQNISSGNYIVTVTDASGCFTVDTFFIANLNSNFSLSAVSIPNTSCIQPNGSLNLTVNPPGNYVYAWSNGEITEDLSNVAAGLYQVIVTDATGCSSTISVIVDQNTSAPLISGIITPSTCGQNNGMIDLSVGPPAGNTFSWSTGDITEDLINIAPGNYNVTVTDINGCFTVSGFVVPNNNSAFSINGTVNENTSCTIGNGSIDITILPNGIYSYTWSNGSLTEDLQNLASGIYIVTVSDAFNCSSTQSFSIVDSISQPVLFAITTPDTCGQHNGRIDISVTPSVNNVFHWSDGSSNEDLYNLSSGIYSLTVTDANGCSTSGQFNVDAFSSNFSIASLVNDDQSCSAPNGSINITMTPAGTYSCTWSNGSNTEDLTNLASGLYEVTVTDQFSCSLRESYIIENTSTLPVLTGTVTNPACGENIGNINLTVNPPGGNQFIWSSGATTEDLTNMPAGSYSVTVTDLNGCSSTDQFAIIGSPGFETQIDADLSSINNGVVTCSLQLDVPVSTIASIEWFPVELLSCFDSLCLEQVFFISGPTEVLVMVTDTNGCTGQASLLLDVSKDYHVFIPNVFSPNQDGINDMFTVYGNKEIKEIERLEIFDRWGNQLFVKTSFPPNDPSLGWDGTFRGQTMNPDVFVYWAKVLYSNGDEHLFKGGITLLR